jgi:hemoglobin
VSGGARGRGDGACGTDRAGYHPRVSESLYERIGGERALTAAVTLFYEKVMADESVEPFFAGLDMGAQIDKQIAFMTMAFGGPNKYTGRDLRTAHARLVRNGLGDRHFDAIATHLVDTLRELGVEQSLIDEAVQIVAGTREDVLNR